MRTSKAVMTAIVAGATVTAVVVFRRRRELRNTRADLYFADGSMLSLDHDAPEIDRLAQAARLLAGVMA